MLKVAASMQSWSSEVKLNEGYIPTRRKAPRGIHRNNAFLHLSSIATLDARLDDGPVLQW